MFLNTNDDWLIFIKVDCDLSVKSRFAIPIPLNNNAFKYSTDDSVKSADPYVALLAVK